jgi:hypothetical protein
MGARVTEHQDKQLECVDCKQPFTFSAKDQAFFEEKQFVDPKRCAPCRQLKKRQRESRGI